MLPGGAEVANLGTFNSFLLFSSHSITTSGGASGSTILFNNTVTHASITHIIARCHPNLFHLLFCPVHQEEQYYPETDY